MRTVYRSFEVFAIVAAAAVLGFVVTPNTSLALSGAYQSHPDAISGLVGLVGTFSALLGAAFL